MMGGIVSAQFEPQSMSVPVSLDVGEGEGEPSIEPEREVLAGRRRGHAVAAVVVDVRRAERDARELPEQVRLLVRQRPAAERGQRGRAVLLADRKEPIRDEVERRLPGDRGQRPVRAAHHGREESVGLVEELPRRVPLDAHLPAVDGKRLVRDDLQRPPRRVRVTDSPH